MPNKMCKCGDRIYRSGLCSCCWMEHNGKLPSQSEIERMKLLIRRENGHDPKDRQLFPAAARH